MPDDVHFKSFFERLSTMAAVYCVLFGLLVMAGWIFDLDVLKNPFPGQIPVAPTTGFSFFIMGAVLLFGRRQKKKANPLMRVVACSIFTFGALILLPYITHGAVDLEQYFFQHQLSDITKFAPGRMSPNTAAGILLAGLSIFLLTLGKNKFLWAQKITCFIAMFGYFTLLGYLYNVAFLYGVSSYTSMALPTGFAFLILALAIFFYRPAEGLARLLVDAGAAGILARRLVPAALLAPLLLASLKVYALQKGFLGWDSATAFMVVSITVVLLILVGVTSMAVASLDAERHRLWEQRDNFIAVLIHDLKNPLIGSERVLEHLRAGRLDALTPRQQQALELLKDTNTELLQMIKNLLEFYRIEKGRETMQFKALDPVVVARRAGEKFQAHAQAQNKHISLALPESLPEVMGDMVALEQVVGNLLQNAIKFTNAGGVIELSANALESLVVIQVRDDGKGMSAEDQEKLFKPFSQGAAGKQISSGSGIGLYLCDQIVRAHKGHLTCMSELGQGTTFVISLPAKKNNSAQHSSKAQSHLSAGQHLPNKGEEAPPESRGVSLQE